MPAIRSDRDCETNTSPFGNASNQRGLSRPPAYRRTTKPGGAVGALPPDQPIIFGGRKLPEPTGANSGTGGLSVGAVDAASGTSNSDPTINRIAGAFKNIGASSDLLVREQISLLPEHKRFEESAHRFRRGQPRDPRAVLAEIWHLFQDNAGTTRSPIIRMASSGFS
jgi:hypothetical protein